MMLKNVRKNTCNVQHATYNFILLLVCCLFSYFNLFGIKGFCCHYRDLLFLQVRTHFARPNFKKVLSKIATKHPYAKIGQIPSYS
jgi:hypothetical protein